MRAVYTLGYARADALDVAEELVQQGVRLVDIRLSPRSRWYPAWHRAALEQRFGERYVWVQALGNRNYRDRRLPVELASERVGVGLVCWWLAKEDVCLVCACADWRTCHRRVVAELVQAQVQRCQVVHL